jgi:Ca-activated chloride channel family protein
VPHLTLAVGRRRERLRAALLWLGLALIALAIAGPRWGMAAQVRRQTGADLLLLLDCSRSMLAADLYPSRIEAARRKAVDLVGIAPETRMALMPFAAVPVLRCPLTGDHEALSRMLKDCSPDLFPAEQGYQGTAIGDAVQEALRVLAHGAERGQAVLIMSDGSDDDRAAVDRAAKAAKEAGVAVFGLFLGDPDGKATLEIDGKQEAMAATRATLDDLASATGGACVNATTDDADVRALVARIQATVAQRPWESRALITASERYHYPLLPGIALVALGALLPTRRRSRAGSAGMPAKAAA